MSEIHPKYAGLYRSAKIHKQHIGTVQWYTKKILANRARYEAVSQAVGGKVPWWAIGVVHALECSCDFKRHLHNGDPLKRKTVQVPKGRPLKWDGTGTWEASAIDAVKYDRIDQVTDWSIGPALDWFERYNGLGYRRKGVPSPYLWSFTQHYVRGKYVADGQYSASAVSKQPGVVALMIELGVK